MFRLLLRPDDIIAHAEKVWAIEGDRSVQHPDTDNYSRPSKYPCLGAIVLNYSYGGRPRFFHIYCHKNEAKRIVYPSTNKDRSKNSFRFVENKDALWESINTTFRATGIANSRTQSDIFDKVHNICGMNGVFPALYTYINTIITREIRLFRPLVLPLYAAKKLVYYKSFKPLKKSKVVIAPSPSQGIIQIQSAVQRQAMPNTRRGGIVINLSGYAPDVIRFMREREQDFVFREQHELDKMNRELDRDLENVRDNNRFTYVKRSLAVFHDWRKAARKMHARRFPQEVLPDSTNQRLLLKVRSTRSNNA